MSRDVVYQDHVDDHKALIANPKYTPGAFELRTSDAIRRAGRMEDALMEMHTTIHTPKTLLPGNLTDEQFAQRQTILEIAYKIIQAQRDRLMDEVTDLWIEYRKRGG